MKVAIISDIHANKYALESVLKVLNKERVDHILVAGDLVGYYYWPCEVIDFCMGDPRVQCVRGNHEEYLEDALQDADRLSELTVKYGSGHQRCLEAVTSKQLDWLRSLPRTIETKIDDISFFVAHGSLSSADEYIYPDAPLETLISNYSDADFTVFGHTHYAFIHTHNQQCLINPGSVGQPRDFGGAASFAIVDSRNRSVRFKRTPFDVNEIIAASEEFDPAVPYLRKILKRGHA